jgi:hypothetical protein
MWNDAWRCVTLIGIAPLLPLTMSQMACADTSPATVPMTVADYVGATVQIQDPIGSDWRRIPAATLPAHPLVEAYQPNHWIEINANGRDVLISILSVDLDGGGVPGVLIGPHEPLAVITGGFGCPHEPPAEIAGTAGLGGCSK